MDFDRLYTKALKYLSRRPRSEKELRDYLLKKKKWHSEQFLEIQQATIEKIVEKLKEQRFLNDEEFTQWWIEQRTRFKKKGWRAIVFELKNKGISEDIIKHQELKVKSDDRELERDERELARELIQQRIKRYQGLSKEELYRKLGGFLARRGFDLDIIRACIDEVLRK